MNCGSLSFSADGRPRFGVWVPIYVVRVGPTWNVRRSPSTIATRTRGPPNPLASQVVLRCWLPFLSRRLCTLVVRTRTAEPRSRVSDRRPDRRPAGRRNAFLSLLGLFSNPLLTLCLVS